jgi:hypothetical protein
VVFDTSPRDRVVCKQTLAITDSNRGDLPVSLCNNGDQSLLVISSRKYHLRSSSDELGLALG